MLERQDLEQIRAIVEEKNDLILHAFKEHAEEVQAQIRTTNERIDRLYSLVDGYIALHQKVDIELAALRSRVERQEGEILILKQKLAMG